MIDCLFQKCAIGVDFGGRVDEKGTTVGVFGKSLARLFERFEKSLVKYQLVGMGQERAKTRRAVIDLHKDFAALVNGGKERENTARQRTLGAIARTVTYDKAHAVFKLPDGQGALLVGE